MLHGALDMFEVKRRAPHHDVLVVARQALDSEALEPPLRNRFSHVLYLVPKEGGAEEELVRIFLGASWSWSHVPQICIEYCRLERSYPWSAAPAMPSGRGEGFRPLPCCACARGKMLIPPFI